MLTFGMAGLGLLILAVLAYRDGAFSRPVSTFGIALAFLLILVYLGRLIILTPDQPAGRRAGRAGRGHRRAVLLLRPGPGAAPPLSVDRSL